MREGDVQFRVMSYNILAPVFAERHRDLYTGDTRHLEWDTRWRGIQEEITSHNPDIVTLQEVQFVDNIFKNDILPWFEHEGYDNVHKQRTNGKEDGCVVFYKRSMFK